MAVYRVQFSVVLYCSERGQPIRQSSGVVIQCMAPAAAAGNLARVSSESRPNVLRRRINLYSA